MTTETRVKTKTMACDGAIAMSYGVLLSRPEVISMLPITPQHGLVAQIYQFHAQGLLDCDMIEAEGELSAMSIVNAASAAGARTFISSSQAGLFFMWDAFKMPPGFRLPVVMANFSREEVPPASVVHSQQDIVGAKDQGWIQIYAETCQECLDDIIIAYRLAEDTSILLPVIVNVDGFFLSHLTELVEIPAQAEVDRFLAPLKEMNRPKLVADTKVLCSVGLQNRDLAQARYDFWQAMERTKTKIQEIDQEFARTFGRTYGGMIEEYRCEDADIVLMTMGSVTGTARAVVDAKREEGVKVGLIKVRVYRPLPSERLLQALKGKKAVGVIDRNVCLGTPWGHVFHDLRSILYDRDTKLPAVDFIAGIGGLDITPEQITEAINITRQAAQGKKVPEVTWLALE
ncbi:MAG: pyruvate synthase subunit PorA [Chloroflexota bacterium]